MRILLTGVSGQVGNALRDPLQTIGTVIAADRSIIDLSRPETIEGVLSEMMPDLIVNPAAYTAVDRAEDESDLAYLVNATAPARIAAWAATHGVPMIHFSTDYVFDGTGVRPWRESDPTAPLSVYGASKLAGEAAVRNARGPHLIIRTSWVYAAQGTNFLRTILRLAQERDELRIVSDQVGAPTSARVIAAAVCDILRSDPGHLTQRLSLGSGLLHITCQGEASWHDFTMAIVNGLISRDVPLRTRIIHPITTEQYPTKAKRPNNSRLDLNRLRDKFGIETPNWSNALAVELDEVSQLHR